MLQSTGILYFYGEMIHFTVGGMTVHFLHCVYTLLYQRRFRIKDVDSFLLFFMSFKVPGLKKKKKKEKLFSN